MDLPSEMPCRGCGSTATELILDLGDVPASDYFPSADAPGPDPSWPLTWLLCPNCLLVQLGPVDGVLPESPMGRESATSQAHAKRMAGAVARRLGLSAGATVIEIDSHHGGSWQNSFAELGLQLRRPDETADLVVDVHGIPHEPDLDEPLAAHRRRLAPGGRLVFEFHHLLELVRQDQIDTVRHGHWVYLSLLSISRLLARHGLTVVDAEQVDVFGGSLIVTARLSSEVPPVSPNVRAIETAELAAGLDSTPALAEFGKRGLQRTSQLRSHLLDSAAAGRSVAGYGAPSKAPVLLTLADVGPDLLGYTVDLSPVKHGCRLPAAGIPIRSIDYLFEHRPDEVVVLTWDIAAEIVDQLAPAAAAAQWDPDFLTPLPELKYVAGPRYRAAQDQ